MSLHVHTHISLYSVREHSCELSPSTMVNNWVSYLSCWICRAESRESLGSLANKLRPNESFAGPTDIMARVHVCTLCVQQVGDELQCTWTRTQEFKWWQVCVCVCTGYACAVTNLWSMCGCVSAHNTTEDFCACMYVCVRVYNMLHNPTHTFFLLHQMN